MAKDREAAAAERARNPFPGYDDAFAAAMDAEARPDRRPVPQDRRGRLSALAARYRHWKRRWFPKRS